MQLERRFYPAVMEVRAASADKPPILSGYASVFGVLSQVMWGFRERVDAKAFNDTLADDIRALWNHNTDFPLGRTTNQTLSLAVDTTGLKVEIEPPATQLAKDFTTSIQRGDVDQMSIGFRTLEDTWDIDEQGQVIRTLLKLKLYEVSPVTFPAYTDTSIGVRGQLAVDEIVEIPAEIRRALDSAAGAGRAQVRLAMLRRRLTLI